MTYYIVLLSKVDEVGKAYYELWNNRYYVDREAAENRLEFCLTMGHSGIVKEINLEFPSKLEVRTSGTVEETSVADIQAIDGLESRKVDFGLKSKKEPSDGERLDTEAFKCRESLLGRADGYHQGIYPWWHGWAIVDAYKEGYASGKEDGQLEAN